MFEIADTGLCDIEARNEGEYNIFGKAFLKEGVYAEGGGGIDDDASMLWGDDICDDRG